MTRYSLFMFTMLGNKVYTKSSPKQRPIHIVLLVLVIGVIIPLNLEAQFNRPDSLYAKTFYMRTSFNYLYFEGKLSPETDSVHFNPQNIRQNKWDVIKMPSLRYYGEENKQALYKRIRNGENIRNAYVDFPIVLKEIDSSKSEKIFSYNLIFENSYIKYISNLTKPLLIDSSGLHSVFVDYTEQYGLIFSGDFVLKNCNIGAFAVTNTWFKKHLTLDNNSIKGVNFLLYHIRVDSLFTLRKNDRQESDTARGVTYYLQKNGKYFLNGVTVQIATFNKGFLITNTGYYPVILKNIETRRSDIFSSATFLPGKYSDPNELRSNIIFENVIFSGETKLAGNIANIKFKHCTIRDTLRFDDSFPVPDNRYSFEEIDIEFLSDTRVFLFPDYRLTQIGLQPSELKKIIPHYLRNNVSYWYDNDKALATEIITAENKTDWLAADREDIAQRFRFFRAEYRKQHLAQHATGISEWVEYLGLLITGTVVNHGYHGFDNFLGWLAIVVFCFSIIYMWRFRHVITTYVTTGEFSPYDFKPVQYPAKNKLQRFFIWVSELLRCCWFSFVVLVNPRWPSRYFRFSSGLIVLIFVEWAVGIGLLFLFVMYILATNPFVKTFLAL